MDETLLFKLGMNRNEAKVYLALLKLGSSSAGALIKLTDFHRNIVYDNLRKLIDKGLVSYIFEDGIRLFKVNSPEAIMQMLDKEQVKLDERKKIATSVKKQVLERLSIRKEEQEATVFRGVSGLKVLLKDTLLESSDYCVFGAPKASLDIMGDVFWKNYNLKREEKKIIIKMIFNEELRGWSNQIQSKLTQIRFLPKKFDSLTETFVYNDKVAIVVWTEKPVATLIKDSDLAKAYKQYFDILWKQSKK